MNATNLAALTIAALAAAAPATAPARSASHLPPAAIAADQGGPVVITGEWNYTSSLVPQHFQEAVVALFNVSPYLRGEHTTWVPRDSQVLGQFTTPLSPAPTRFRVDVPRQARGTSADVDNDGADDAGVRVYAVHIGPNMVADSYLEQMEQVGDNSYRLHPLDGSIREGTFLVHAPDASQGFPSSAGADGRFFTADDPAVALPAGWTLVTLRDHGTVHFDRSATARMDVLEDVAAASPDFSSQGILQSFESLVDLLKQRYAYTELRRLDWEVVRATYRPRVAAADAANDRVEYYLALNDLAHSIRDAHVYVDSGDVGLRKVPMERYLAGWGGTLGAGGVELSDGRYVITYVDPKGPAAKAGWTFGTEVLRVDGVPIATRIDGLPLVESAGTPEAIRLKQAFLALAFPVGTKVTVDYRQPEGGAERSVALTAGEGFQTVAPVESDGEGDIAYRELEGGYGYVKWSMFRDPLYMVTIWEKFLAKFGGAPGLVIDLRTNGGGNGELMFTMASYFFTADAPANYHWLDYYVFDETAGGLVKSFAYDYPLYSPRPELTYLGAVAVLVGEGSASAAEYMPQFLQRHGRAIVIGERSTEGAGGYVERAALPGSINFYFTKGRSFFAGTDELNLEAKGVKLDVRVPITVANERAKLEGRDPVLEAAVAALGPESVRRAQDRLVGRTWQLTTGLDARGSRKPIATPQSYTVQLAADGSIAVQADCNRALGTYTFGPSGAVTIKLGPTTLAACPEGSLGSDFLRWLGAARQFQFNGTEMGFMTDPESGMMALVFQLAANP